MTDFSHKKIHHLFQLKSPNKALLREKVKFSITRICKPCFSVSYIHHNLVKDRVVTEPEDYYFSSARNSAYLGSVIDVEVVFMG